MITLEGIIELVEESITKYDDLCPTSEDKNYVKDSLFVHDVTKDDYYECGFSYTDKITIPEYQIDVFRSEQIRKITDAELLIRLISDNTRFIKTLDVINWYPIFYIRDGYLATIKNTDLKEIMECRG